MADPEDQPFSHWIFFVRNETKPVVVPLEEEELEGLYGHDGPTWSSIIEFVEYQLDAMESDEAAAD